MANLINIDEKENNFIKALQKAVQSANLNFLIGSGCSLPAINILGNIEKDIQDKLKMGHDDEAEDLTFNFLTPIIENTTTLVKDDFINNCKSVDHYDILKTYNNYKKFIDIISNILFERKSNILHKQATIFSTNYDLFIENIAEQFSGSLVLNDGIKRTPSLNNTFKFSTSEFFQTIFNTGNLYNYQVQIPSINLIKIHGSLNWKTKDDNIIHSLDYLENAVKLKVEIEADRTEVIRKKLQEKDTGTQSKEPNDDSLLVKMEKFNNLFSIILPKKDKFKETLLNQIYYDLLRIYSNELDKENTLLIVEGFSFADEHIFEITKRALKNPTLKIIIFSYSSDSKAFTDKFSPYNNVDIVYSKKGNINFEAFNSFLAEILPKDVNGLTNSVENEESDDK